MRRYRAHYDVIVVLNVGLNKMHYLSVMELHKIQRYFIVAQQNSGHQTIMILSKQYIYHIQG